jgi:SAM-dependent methyltransferase
MKDLVEGFSNPWEHVRLLSDKPRNEAMLELLRRHAAGRRVLEVGCGSGLLSVAAARLGATEVFAVEPGGLVHTARELVHTNGLSGTVRVIASTIEAVEAAPVDLAFSELLNADPYVEGVLDAMEHAATWLAPGGLCAPSRLRVLAALVRDDGCAGELRSATAEVARMAAEFGIDVHPVVAGLRTRESYRYVTESVRLASEPVVVHDVAVGGRERPPAHAQVALHASEPGPVGGVVLWFEATLADGLILHNRPGHPGHWGHLVCAWGAEVGLRSGQALAIDVTVDDELGIDAVPA